MPAGYPDLDALLRGAKDSLGRANALASQTGFTTDDLPPPPVTQARNPGPFPGADAPQESLFSRIANWSPVPKTIGREFAEAVDPASDRDSKAMAGTYGPLDRVKSFLAGAGGGWLNYFRQQGMTPAGLATMLSYQPTGLVGNAARVVSGGVQTVRGVESASQPDATTGDRALGALDALLGATTAATGFRFPGRGATTEPLGDAERVFEPNPAWDRMSAANRQAARRSMAGDVADTGPTVRVEPYPTRGLPEPQPQIGSAPIQPDASPVPDAPTPAPSPQPSPAESSPLARLFKVRVPADEAAANLRDFGSVLGPAHASDELAAMEREQGPLSDAFKQQFLSRRQGMHLDERRMDNEWKGLVAEFKDNMGRGPTIAPASDQPAPQSLADLLRASVAASAKQVPASKILADVESGRVPKFHDVPDGIYSDLRAKLGGTGEPVEPVGGPRSSEPNIAAETDTPAVPPEDLHRYLNERGEIDPKLALQLGLHATGAVGGAAAGHAIGTRSGHATRDTALGALLGGVAPALLTPEGRNLLLSLRASGMVSGPMTLAKKIAGDTGAVGAEALEGSIGKGDPSYGLNLLKQFFSPETLDVAKRSFQDAGDSEGIASTYLNSPVIKKGPLAIPGRMLGAATDATQDAMQRGGIGPKQAQDLTYLGTPKTALGKWLVSRPQEARWVLPMVRVATNLAEKGAARTPVGALYRLLNTPDRSPELTRRILTQGAVGTGAMAAGAALHDPNSKRTTALEAAALGPYALPYEAGALIKDAIDPRHTPTQDIYHAADSINQLVPMPEMRQPSDLAAMFIPKAVADVSEGMDYPNDRNTSRDFFDKLAAKIPGLRSQLPYKPPAHAR